MCLAAWLHKHRILIIPARTRQVVAWNGQAPPVTCRLHKVHACHARSVAQVIALFSPVSADDADGNGGLADSLSVSEQAV